jgi:uncharacterized protein
MPDPRHIAVTAAICVLALAGYQAVHGTSRAPAASSPKPSGVLQPFLRFTGSGAVTMRPDRGTISFSTHGTGATLAAAQQQAGAAMRALIARMRADGVAAADLRTDGVSGFKRRRASGYTADQSLTVTIRDLAKTGTLLADGAAAGAQSTSGVDFSISRRRQAYDGALRAAVADARAKADTVAAAAGLHVSGVVSVDESQNQVYYGTATALAAPSPAPVPVQRGTQRVTAQVTVVFAYSS